MLNKNTQKLHFPFICKQYRPSVASFATCWCCTYYLQMDMKS